MRRAAKRDTSQSEIVQALEQVGARVWHIGLPCDLLVLWRERWHTMECKTPLKRGGARKRHDQPAQQAFLASTPTPIVKTPLEALRAIGAIS